MVAPFAQELWDEMVSAGEAEFSLALTVNGAALPLRGRERALVEVAIAAGVVGALETIRRGQPEPSAGP